ncbi:MAG: Thiamine pyrophosphokinase [Deltaproteobacteria bacterium]|jgi:thiamine pyrophosphokinase|nr:Thiamine pyrophosphokinase [Deltaproteobacteria bacterium]
MTETDFQKQEKLLNKALIICNGNPPPESLLSQLWEKTTYRVAADGGANQLLRNNYTPDAVVGDFDSLKPETREKMPNSEFVQIKDQDTNDADKAVRHCLELGIKGIHLLGADGGRQDHFLSGLEILFKYSEQARLITWTPLERLEFIQQSWEENIAPGTTLSLLPVFGGAQGVVTQGLKFSLNNQDLIPGGIPSGVSNIVVSNPVSIKLKSGRLLLVVQHTETYS